MAVKARTTGEGFSRRTDPALFDSRNSPADHRDTIGSHNARRLWTLDGQLVAVENVARSIPGCEDAGEDGSPAFYARKALKLIDIIRHEAAQGNSDQVGRWSLELGGLWREFELKLEFERQALASSKGGRKAAANRWGGGDATKARYAQYRADFQAEREKGRSVAEADAAVVRKHGVGLRTVQRARASD